MVSFYTIIFSRSDKLKISKIRLIVKRTYLKICSYLETSLLNFKKNIYIFGFNLKLHDDTSVSGLIRKRCYWIETIRSYVTDIEFPLL